MTSACDRHAEIIIIGGGAIGTSIAYHLARAGKRDVLVLEKSQLTNGCTWHAAGLVGQLRGKRNLTRLMQNSVAVFDRLGAEADAAVDWKKVGSLRLAASPDRWSEIRRSMTQAKSFGVECEALSASEARQLFDYIDTSGIEGAAFIPGDGYIDPYALTHAFAKAARAGGVKIEEGVTVTDLIVEDRRITGVVSDHGTIGCDVLVNCAGLWAKRVGEMAGIKLAAGVVEHQYFLTEKALDFSPDLTTLRDPDHNFYLKPDTGAFAIGGWEEGTKGCWRGRPPLEFGRELFPANMERLELFALPAAERLPVLNEIGIQTVINGPIPVSADGEPIMGLVPELDNFYVACAFTAGIAASGGAGEAMANWIVHNDPGMDLWAFDVRRFGAVHGQSRYLEARAIEAYAAYYKIHWPGEEAEAGRALRRSPLFDRLKAQGAVYGSKFGWERANWFAPRGSDAKDGPSFEEKPNWFNAVGAECEAIAERAALIDQSSFSKFEVSGPGAFAALEKIAANKVPEVPGRAVYTQLCNASGGIEADLTIIHHLPDTFLVITGSGFGVRDSNWIARQLPRDGSVAMREVTRNWATLNLCGPRARDILAAVTDQDVSAAALPFLSAKTLEVGLAEVLAVRIGYVGELGWELYIPAEFAGHVYDTLWQAGTAHGIANAGYRAVEACRLEKGYVYWSSDVGPDVNPYEAGLGFCVALEKGDFTGREALQAIRGQNRRSRLATLRLEGFVPLHGSEPVIGDGEILGAVSSAGFGYRVAHSIAFAHLPAHVAEGTTVEIEAFGRTYPATVAPRCLYDPEMTRLRE
ncbi:MAG: FAD-dependent oxidoreductase [Pseudomonadota bacterium]